jgi:hypothetical protein
VTNESINGGLVRLATKGRDQFNLGKKQRSEPSDRGQFNIGPQQRAKLPAQAWWTCDKGQGLGGLVRKRRELVDL